MAAVGGVRAPARHPKADTRLASIYAEHESSLRKRCTRLTGDPLAAEDLMQEVFARFLARFPEPPAGMNVRGYLLATAHNIRVNQLRAEGGVAVEEIDDTRTPMIESSTTPSARSSWRNSERTCSEGRPF